MKRRVKIPNKMLIILFIIAIVISIVATYFSVYANSAESYSNPDYKSIYAEHPKEANVGIVIKEGDVDNASP